MTEEVRALLGLRVFLVIRVLQGNRETEEHLVVQEHLAFLVTLEALDLWDQLEIQGSLVSRVHQDQLEMLVTRDQMDCLVSQDNKVEPDL